MKVSTFLRKARALIRKGWMQRRSQNYDRTKFCISGAIDRVEYLANNRLPTRAAEAAWLATTYLCLSLPQQYSSIVDYNDASKRTKKQVLALFDRAIKKAEKEASQ